SANIFAVIAKHLASAKGLGDQAKTVFQFNLTNPESAWTLDMKSGDGEVKQGAAANADVTLELSDEDFVAMSTGKAEPNKLSFGGKMKITGNVMASQKLAFLQKIDPKLMAEVLQSASAPAAAGSAPKAAAKARTGRSAEIFAALEKRMS